MAVASRTYRIFVSSTFTDLKAERDALQKYVVPRLKDLCEQGKARFQAIDLRWGVSEEAALDQQTIHICLTEIKRCQKLTPRPNFVVLLGDRYGWRPPPSRIRAEEFEGIHGRVSEEQQALLDEWYAKDDNAVPSEYYLKPRDPESEFADYERWDPIERQLRSALLAGIEGTPSPPYVASATEQEIDQGLEPPDAPEHVFSFLRELKTGDGLPLAQNFPPGRAAGRYVDLEPEPSEALDTDAHERLQALKQRLRDRLPGNVHEYGATWATGGISTDHIGELPRSLDECLALLDDADAPRTLCVDAWKELARVIQRQLDQLGAASEAEIHHDFAEERATDFVGRAEILADIADYLAGDEEKLCAVVGAPGSGKSALLAKAAEQARSAHPHAVVLDRYIGASAGSSDIRNLLSELCEAISRAYGDTTPVPTEYQELASELPKRLALASAAKPLILFLDALDQLSESQGARNLVWLPGSPTEHARVVVSTRHELFEPLQRKYPKPELLSLGRLSRDEGDELLGKWLAAAERTLQPSQREHILDTFDRAGGMPLYLKLLFEEARLWKSDTPPKPFGEDIEGVIRENLFTRQKEHHGKLLVERSLAYLAASRHGLAEDELLALLSRDEELYQEVKEEAERARQELPEADLDRRLPVAVWSRLSLDLDAYLTERLLENVSLLAFYHRELGTVATEEYLKADVAKERHAALADYFRSRVDPAEDGTWTGADTRGLSELPYHLAEAERLDDLFETLTDFRFLERKAAEVGVEEHSGTDGEPTKTYTGVFQLQDDYELALRKFGGGEAAARKPLIVTAVDFRDGDGLRVGCPWCNTRHPFDEDWRDKEIECPNCKGPLKVNPFVVGEALSGDRE